MAPGELHAAPRPLSVGRGVSTDMEGSHLIDDSHMKEDSHREAAHREAATARARVESRERQYHDQVGGHLTPI